MRFGRVLLRPKRQLRRIPPRRRFEAKNIKPGERRRRIGGGRLDRFLFREHQLVEIFGQVDSEFCPLVFLDHFQNLQKLVRLRRREAEGFRLKIRWFHLQPLVKDRVQLGVTPVIGGEMTLS